MPISDTEALKRVMYDVLMRMDELEKQHPGLLKEDDPVHKSRAGISYALCGLAIALCEDGIRELNEKS